MTSTTNEHNESGDQADLGQPWIDAVYLASLRLEQLSEHSRPRAWNAAQILEIRRRLETDVAHLDAVISRLSMLRPELFEDSAALLDCDHDGDPGSPRACCFLRRLVEEAAADADRCMAIRARADADVQGFGLALKGYGLWFLEGCPFDDGRLVTDGERPCSVVKITDDQGDLVGHRVDDTRPIETLCGFVWTFEPHAPASDDRQEENERARVRQPGARSTRPRR